MSHRGAGHWNTVGARRCRLVVVGWILRSMHLAQVAAVLICFFEVPGTSVLHSLWGMQMTILLLLGTCAGKAARESFSV